MAGASAELLGILSPLALGPLMRGSFWYAESVKSHRSEECTKAVTG